jgi:putative heme-binding domain-containing protein
MSLPSPIGISPRIISLFAAACIVALTSPDALGEAAGKLRLPPGFRSELVYAVPLESQGSWVSLCTDDRGRIIAGDQDGALYRVTPSALGGDAKQTKVERLTISIGMAHGLLYHRGHLYVMQNGRIGSFSTGLYRVSDTDGDDQFDTIRQIRVFEGEGEHGPHAIVPSPDGNQLYICCGNFTKLPLLSRSLPPQLWQEDQLLPRIGDPRGHANDIKAPGGWIARMDLDGDNLELVSVGYRNMYDIAMNADGELFTYDSDMEWDIGTPWYRPTRVCHVTSGSDFGWRGGNGVWPAYFVDTLPTVADSGPGSPTGLTFGTGTKFPPKYQQALFGGDWSYGNIYAFHVQPKGSSYQAEVERFASAMPLGVTDMIVRKEDGALYFAVGGRNSESALYRIVWTGEGAEAGSSDQAASAPTQVSSSSNAAAPSPSEARDLRHSLEKLHAAAASEKVVQQAWPHLGSPDRFVSTAARIAIEHQPFQSWQQLALQEESVDARIIALVAYARVADRAEQGAWADAIAKSTLPELTREQRLNLLRAASLGAIRFDPLEPATRQKLLATFDPSFPSGNGDLDRELSHLLVRLRASDIIPRLLDLMEGSPTQEEAIDAAMTLSCVTDGWAIDQRTRLLDWFDKSSRMAGGMSFFGYLVAARDRFIGSMPATDRAHVAERLSKPFAEQPAQIEAEVRPFVREWTLDEVDQLVQNDHGQRDFENGRKMFAAAGCYNCHRVGGSGSSIGPDLTGVGGRFGARDLLRSVIEPDHTISDQYQQMVFETNGRIIVGRVTNIHGESIHISTNMLDPKSTVTIKRDELDDQYPSEVSVMPAGLLNTLSADEILDLTAFLRSGGRPDHELFSTGGGK